MVYLDYLGSVLLAILTYYHLFRVWTKREYPRIGYVPAPIGRTYPILLLRLVVVGLYVSALYQHALPYTAFVYAVFAALHLGYDLASSLVRDIFGGPKNKPGVFDANFFTLRGWLALLAF